MAKKNATQKYVDEAIKEVATSNISLNNVNIEVKVEAADALKELAKALTAQAEANEANSDAIASIAAKLQPESCLKITREGFDYGQG